VKFLRVLLVLLIFVAATLTRVNLFDESGRDINTYKRAVEEFLEGKNPYEWTVKTYDSAKDPWNHGFATLPGLLFVNAPLYLIHLSSDISLDILWKIPVLLADLGIGLFLFKTLNKKNYYMAVFGLAVWLFNPYMQVIGKYSHTDPIAIFFLLLGLYFLEEDDVLAGVFYALAVAFKTFPLILLPLFLIKSDNKIRFITAAGIIGFALSVPFMSSIYDFTTYVKGALLVHGSRIMQGRPFLFYISYYYKIELFQIIPTSVYAKLALFSGWIASILVLFKNKNFDKYVLSLICFILFYAFTPVLNRTYLLWFMPVLIVALSKLVSTKKFYLYFLSLTGFYSFYFWYISQWKDGFHIWHP
jgi:hypothetical protein